MRPNLSHYRIQGELGSGGMGVVYDALDTRLNRRVAVKVLPAEVAARPDRMRRFRTEAQSLAALNHPNIVTVYSVEQDEDIHFITMERVDGQSLDRLISPGGFELGRFLKIAIAVSDALAAAEAKGITHRDLKPANVMISDDGWVKIIDLGLAKLVEVEPAGDRGGVAESGTPTLPASVAGGVVGTPAYMSPEHIEGRPVDHRSDIFSLGVLLYEMLTGERPFRGGSPVALMSSVLRDTPAPLAERREGLPPELGRIVRRCLEKDPGNRFQSASEICSRLKDVRDEFLASQTGVRLASPVKAPERGWPRMIVPLVIALVVAGGALWWALKRGSAGGGGDPAGAGGSGAGTAGVAVAHRWSDPAPWSFDAAIEEWPAWSPNGKRVVFAKNVDGFFNLFVRDFEGGGEVRRLTAGGRDDIQPAWSPDGEWIAFVRSNGTPGRIRPTDVYNGFYARDADVWVVNVASGTERRVVEQAFHPAFSGDGRLAVSWDSDAGLRIAICDVKGHGLRAVTEDDESAFHVEPTWSPDGRRIAFRRIGSKYGNRLAVVDLETRGIHELTESMVMSDPDWALDGRHLYFTANFGTSFNVWRLPVDGEARASGAMERVSYGPGPDVHPAVSPDGKTVLYSILPFNSDLWILPVDPETGSPTGEAHELIATSGEDSRGAFSGDEKWITFSSDREGSMSIYAAAFDAETGSASNPRRLTEGGAGGHYQPQWVPDGSGVVFFGREDANEDIWLVRVGENGGAAGDPVRLTDAPSAEFNPFVSPDSRWVSFLSNRNGYTELWMVALDGSRQTRLTDFQVFGHFQPWYDEKSIVAYSRNIWSWAPEASNVTIRVFIDGRDPALVGAMAGGHLSISPNRRWISENDHQVILRTAVDGVSPKWRDDPDSIIYDPSLPERNPEGHEIGVDYTVISPSGRWIVFDRSIRTGGDVHAVRQVTD